MPQFKRFFYCKECSVAGSLEKLVNDVFIVECPNCLISEIWGNSQVMEPMDYFKYIDEPMARA